MVVNQEQGVKLVEATHKAATVIQNELERIQWQHSMEQLGTCMRLRVGIILNMSINSLQTSLL